ncbi:MAG: FimB/Mfa2 family fimbrial subunit [Bacteroidia bacterium]|nr:FimB/Mfa2 family fimbrial subunit [Bacteroidia bacterium]
MFTKKNILKIKLIVAFFLGVLFSSCDSVIYDDLSECPMGVYVSFYTLTPVGDTLTVFPQNNINQELNLMVFDSQGKLVHIIKQQFPLAANQKVFVPIEKAGEYSFVAWSGTPGSFSLTNASLGSSKDAILAKLTRDANDNITADSPAHIFEGSFRTHEPEFGGKYINSPNYGHNTVVFHDPAEYGSQFREILIGMKEITQQLTLTLKGASRLLTDVTDLKVSVIAKNGDYLLNGGIAPNGQVINYSGLIRVEGDDLKIDFLKLGKLFYGQDIKLRITFTQKNGVTFEREYSLIELIMLDPKYKNETFDFSKHFFLELSFTYYLSAEGEVMNWTAVSRDVVLKN